jgi:hypothetical protein
MESEHDQRERKGRAWIGSLRPVVNKKAAHQNGPRFAIFEEIPREKIHQGLSFA